VWWRPATQSRHRSPPSCTRTTHGVTSATPPVAVWPTPRTTPLAGLAPSGRSQLTNVRATVSSPSAARPLGGRAATGSKPRNQTNRILRTSTPACEPFVSVPTSQPLRRLRPFGCAPSGRPRPPLPPRPALGAQAPLTPPSPLKVSNPFCPGGGRGARSAPLSAPTRPPSPVFAGNVNISSLRSKTNQVERSAIAPLPRASAPPPAPRFARLGTRPIESAASDAWRRRRRSNRGPREREARPPKNRPPRAVGCARPSLASSPGRGKPPRQLTALGGLPTQPNSPAFAPLREPLHSAYVCSPARFRTPSTPQNRRDRHKTGGAPTPGQRITSPGSGNARKLAGLRCGLVMRWPPSSSGLWSGRPTRPCSPPSSACPPRSQQIATPRPTTLTLSPAA